MKIPQLFGRIRPRRTPPAGRIEADWEMPTRDWADLPIYHPKKD
jgi:hypothetical protein